MTEISSSFFESIVRLFVGLLSARTIIVSTILFIVSKYLYDKLSRDPKLLKFAETIPGPPVLPVLGNGLDFFHAGPHAMKKIMEYSEQYGSIFRLWMGKHLIIGMTDVNDLEVVFSSSKMMGKSELFKSFQDFWGDGLFTGPMHIWKKTRKLHQPAFVNNTLPYYVPEFNQKIYSMVESMNKLVDGPEFDAWDYLPYLSFDIIAKTALNVELDAHDKSVLQFHNCVKYGMETSFLRMFRPWLHLKPICDFLLGKEIAKVRGSMLQFAEQTVNSKLEELQKSEPPKRGNTQSYEDFDNEDSDSTIKSFLSAAYHAGIETGSKTLLHDEIITMITGGTDTTGITNSFFLLAVAANPQIQDKLYNEIYEVFGQDDRRADDADISNLPYLDQVLKETLRRFTLVPVIFRQVDENVKVGDRIFPAGTELMISVAGVHFNPKYYPNPWEFNPENFSSDAVEKRHKLTFLPFSAGPRNCIGMNYALLEMKLTLIALLRKFKFHTTVKLEDIRMNMGFLMTSLDGYKMSITLRNRRVHFDSAAKV